MRDPDCMACQGVQGVCTDCEGCMVEHCKCDPCQHGRARAEGCGFCRRFLDDVFYDRGGVFEFGEDF